jgi:hypothetical protein
MSEEYEPGHCENAIEDGDGPPGAAPGVGVVLADPVEADPGLEPLVVEVEAGPSGRRPGKRPPVAGFEAEVTPPPPRSP